MSRIIILFQLVEEFRNFYMLLLSTLFFICLNGRVAGVDFFNILWPVFTNANPKRYWQIDWIFTLLGSVHVKAVRKMLVKLAPDVKFKKKC